MTTVSFEKVTRRYVVADRPAVDALHLDIADGEYFFSARTGQRLPA